LLLHDGPPLPVVDSPVQPLQVIEIFVFLRLRSDEDDDDDPPLQVQTLICKYRRKIKIQ